MILVSSSSCHIVVKASSEAMWSQSDCIRIIWLMEKLMLSQKQKKKNKFVTILHVLFTNLIKAKEGKYGNALKRPRSEYSVWDSQDQDSTGSR